MTGLIAGLLTALVILYIALCVLIPNVMTVVTLVVLGIILLGLVYILMWVIVAAIRDDLD